MRGKCKIIIDTNLWISFLLTKRFDFLDRLFENDKVILVFSDELLSELVEVANRPKLKRFFTENDWNVISDFIDKYAIYYFVSSEITLCRDPKDNFLLALSKDAQADYLLTGDNDLLVLKSFETTEILTISEFRIKWGI